MSGTADAREKKTRAWAHAREAYERNLVADMNTRAQASGQFCSAPKVEVPTIVILAVRVPKIERRVLLVLVDVERNGLRMTFSVARRRGGHLEVCSPRGPDGIGDGVWFPAAERQRVTSAILDAVRGHTGARQTLRV
jgi:hypothetical protein